MKNNIPKIFINKYNNYLPKFKFFENSLRILIFLLVIFSLLFNDLNFCQKIETLQKKKISNNSYSDIKKLRLLEQVVGDCSNCKDSFGYCAHDGKKCNVCKSSYYPKQTYPYSKIPTKPWLCYKSTTAGYFVFYDDIKKYSYLKVCDKSCKTCKTKATNCLSCASGYYNLHYNTYTCLLGANPGAGFFFNSSDNFIYDCGSSCAECIHNRDNCTKCKENFFPTFGLTFPTACYSKENSPQGKCLRKDHLAFGECDSSCQDGKCINDCCHKCLNCKENYFPINGKDFPTECYKSLEGYYLSEDENNNKKTWKKCDESCSQCEISSPENCLKCAKDFYLKYGKSFPSKCHSKNLLTQGYFIDDNYLKECDPNCKTCSKDSKNCLSCFTGKHLKFGDDIIPARCYEKSELPQYFLNNDDSKFHKCSESCDKCTEKKVKCIQCASDFYPKTGTSFPTECFKDIEDLAYFLKNDNNIRKWQKCDKSCSLCNEEKKCLKCAKNSFVKLNTDLPAICYQNPYDGYFVKENKWHKCSPNCLTCTQAENNCLTCSEIHYLKKGETFPRKCHENSEGFYVNLQTKELEKCDKKCKNCVQKADKCAHCCYICPEKNYECRVCSIENYMPLEDNEVFCHSKINKKIYDENIQLGYFYSENDHKFMKCDISCKYCDKKGEENCEENKCNTEINYFPLEDKPSKCIKKNSKENYYNQISNQGYVYLSEEKKFKKCDKSCRKCEKFPSHCNECSRNYYPLKENIHKCLDSPNIGYFINEKNFIEKCDKSCLECRNNKYFCLKCNDGFYPLYNNENKCFEKDKSPDNYIFSIHTDKHEKCDDNCLTCKTTKIKCTSCFNDLLLNKETNKCVEKCPIGFFKTFEDFGLNDKNNNIKIKVCKKCIENCFSCSKENSCDKCYENFYLERSKNQLEIIQNENNKVDIDKCLINCSEGYFKDKEKKICKKCENNCKTCLSENECLSCKNDLIYSKFHKKCLINCPLKFYKTLLDNTDKSKGFVCEKCLDKNCLKCSNKNRCQKCEKNFHLFTAISDIDHLIENKKSKKKISIKTECVSKCPNGYIHNIQTKKCKNFLYNFT